jgi:insecticidal toxin complex protein TccC
MAVSLHANVHHATPSMMVQDPRGLWVRNVEYHRARAGDSPQPRITRQVYSQSGLLEAAWDPRQWQAQGAPNLTQIHSLSGVILLNHSADAGWRARMNGAANELRFERDGRGNQRQIHYDNQLRPITLSEHTIDDDPVTTERLTYANSHADFASHNQCGRTIRHDDSAGCAETNEYGLEGSTLKESRRFANKLNVVDWPESPENRDKHLETIAAITVWQFNPLGELTTQTDARINVRSFAYDIAGQLQRIMLERKQLPDAILLRERRYSASGQIEHETAGNGVVTTRSHDPESDRLIQLTSARLDRVLQNLAYSYDPVGNIIRTEDLLGTVSYCRNQRTDTTNRYAYDSLSQLIESSGRECVRLNLGPGKPGATVTCPQSLSPYKQFFSYDQAGNLVSLAHEGLQRYTREMMTDAASNRSLPKPQTGEPDFINSFDGNGNLLTLSPGSRAMVWDRRNQLSEIVHVARNDTADDDELYRYDSHGQRLRKVQRRRTKFATVSSEVRYLPGLQIHSTDNKEIRCVVTVDVGDCAAQALHWNEQPPEGVTNEQIRYQLSDHLGSCTMELDEAAAVISQEGYYAFGGTSWWLARSDIEASFKTTRYSGKERDASGLYYYGLRYYAPWLQRWINPDPAGDIDGLNRYRMVQNNPIRFKDNQGLAPVEPLNKFERKMVATGRSILY